jgi:hypothetical protein
MVLKFDLDVTIPYEDGKEVIKPKVENLYFSQEEGTVNAQGYVWKFGISHDPYLRKNSLQTGNSNPLFVRYILEPNSHNPEMREVEKVLKRALRKIKTRDKKKLGKGEWIRASNKFIKELVTLIKNNPADYQSIHSLV